MIERFKGVTATLSDWNSTNKIIPKDIWAIVVIEGTKNEPTKLGLKIGSGRLFQNTPYIISPAMLETKIDKPSVDLPSAIKFLAEDGIYHKIDLSEIKTNLDDLLLDLDKENLQIPTKSQVEWISQQMYTPPQFTTFSSSSSLIGKVDMGTSIQGDINLNWLISNKENISEVSISVSEGVWSGDGEVSNPVSTTSKKITSSSPITFNNIKNVQITISGKDSKGNSINTKTLNIVYTHRIYYGTVDTPVITSFGDITRLNSIHSNSRKHTVSFNPVGSQYSIVLIPVEIDQSAINIVNVNAPNIDHSYNMNEGEGGTLSKYTLTKNGIIYNAYVSYGATAGASSSQIK